MPHPLSPLLAAIDAFGDDEEGFFSREGQFVERILELGRVTKVGSNLKSNLNVAAATSSLQEGHTCYTRCFIPGGQVAQDHGLPLLA